MLDSVAKGPVIDLANGSGAHDGSVYGRVRPKAGLPGLVDEIEG